MIGALSLSTMVPITSLPPMVSLTVSSASSMLSLVVGTLTVKLVTPVGTVIFAGAGVVGHTVAEAGRTVVVGRGGAILQQEVEGRAGAADIAQFHREDQRVAFGRGHISRCRST